MSPAAEGDPAEELAVVTPGHRALHVCLVCHKVLGSPSLLLLHPSQAQAVGLATFSPSTPRNGQGVGRMRPEPFTECSGGRR